MFPLNRAALKRLIRFNALRRGLLGGSKFWLTIFVGGWLRKRVQSFTKGGEMPIQFSEKLKVGESYEIRHMAPAKRRRKSSAKA